MKKEYRNGMRTKRMIRDAFVELLGEKKRMEEISVRALAERADVAKSTFYNHYTDVWAVAEEMQDELISHLCASLDEIDAGGEYEPILLHLLGFLKGNEALYRRMMCSPDAAPFLERLKITVSEKVFAENRTLPFAQNKAERYAQVRLLTHACVDTVADYFRGALALSLEELGALLLSFLSRLQAGEAPKK